MTERTSFPTTARDEGLRDAHALAVDCPYFWIDGGRYRSIDGCMEPDVCRCWQKLQNEREVEEANSEQTSI
jgi:hypothetical protein